MKIAVVGTGYVGLVSGACFAEMGLDITCVDVDRKKIDALNNGLIPIYEPGLEELVKRNVEEGRLHFTTELTDCLDKVEVVFSAVGTPPDEDGSADLKYVLEVARAFGRNIKKYTVLVTKSTVPVGTAQKVKAVIREEIDFTILDFVADRRAPTPSAAAELAVPDRAELLRALSQLEQGCQSAMQRRLDAASGRLMMAEQQLSYDMTRRKLTGGQAELAAVQKELEAAAQSCIQKRQAQLRHAAALADSLSPYRVLGRGYAMVYDSKGRLCSADVLATGDKLTLRGAAHTAECTVTSVEELNESTQKL